VSELDLTTSILLMGVLCTLYTMMGGLEAVIWTDVLQTFVLVGGAFVSLAFVLVSAEGGVAAMVRLATSKGKLFERVAWEGPLLSGTAVTIIVGSLFHNLFAYTASQDVVQRYVTTRDEATARRAIWLNGIMSVPAQAVFFCIGTALFAFYAWRPERLDPAMSTDAIFPFFIVHELPAGLAGLIVAGIFAASQSTLSSSMNSIATAYVTDVHRRLRPQATDAACLRLARAITLGTGVLGIGIALWIGGSGVRSAFEAFLSVIGLFGGPVSGLFALGIFSRRANGRGALMGAIVGAVTVYLLRTHVHFYAYAFTGVTVTMTVGYVASLVLPARPKDLAGLTLYTLARRTGGPSTP
jgi:SSS family transporter